MDSDAIAALRRVTEREPEQAAGWLALGEALQRAGRSADALAALARAASIEPENSTIYRALAAAHRTAGDAAEGMAAELAATAFDARSPLALYNIATAYFQAGRWAKAKHWYGLTLRLDPDMVGAHRNLAALFENEGRLAQARRHRDAAYGRQNLFIEPAAVARRTVLILSAAGLGNVPIDFLFPPQSTTRIYWFIDYATEGQADRLLPHDLVFNAIGDPDMALPLRDEVARFLARSGAKLLNPPAVVARTRRDLLPRLLANIAAVEVPAVLRLDRDAIGDAALAAKLAGAGLRFPVILRPAGSHGGAGVTLVERAEALAQIDLGEADAFYATAYRDCRSSDGYFRKYRMIFVDREPYPYHLAISQHWLVHYFSADMLQPSWKRREEQRYLENPKAALGSKAMAAIAAIGRRLDLDFCGIDFALLGDGSVLVFEANATMLVHLKDAPDAFPYKHVHVPKIFAAFEMMLARRTAAVD